MFASASAAVPATVIAATATPPRVARRAPLSLSGHHVRRLEAAIDFVDAHLCEPLPLERVANVAAISPFHFHRLFHHWSGETASEFVRRRRLDVAAGRLRHCPHEKITTISLNCGFASPEGFARAFRERFGMTPSNWRDRDLDRRGGVAPGRAGVPAVKVTREPEIDVLYLRGRGAFGEVVPALWERLLGTVRALGLEGQPLLFMCPDDPRIVSASLCRMEACVQLPAGFGPMPACPPALLRRRIPARWVATAAYDGASASIADGWDALLEGWLPLSAHQLAIGAFHERYDPGCCLPGGRHARCELVMPVEVRAA